jgi:hypothetical protein
VKSFLLRGGDLSQLTVGEAGLQFIDWSPMAKDRLISSELKAQEDGKRGSEPNEYRS